MNNIYIKTEFKFLVRDIPLSDPMFNTFAYKKYSTNSFLKRSVSLGTNIAVWTRSALSFLIQQDSADGDSQ